MENDVQMMRKFSRESRAFFTGYLTLGLSSKAGHPEKFHAYFEKTLQILLTELGESQGTMNTGTICAGLIICTLSIIQGLPWTQHLNCMANLSQCLEDIWMMDLFPDPFYVRVIEAMAVMDLPTLVLGRTTPHMGLWKQIRQAQGDGTSGIEPVTGLPRTLLDIFADADKPTAQEDLWNWHGQTSEALIQSYFWDSSRFSGILLLRRSQASAGRQNDGTRTILPSTEHILWKLVALLDALRLNFETPGMRNLLAACSLLHPYIGARSEFALLRRHPEWLASLERFRRELTQDDLSENERIAFQMIDEAWENDIEEFDMNKAALQRSVELALF